MVQFSRNPKYKYSLLKSEFFAKSFLTLFSFGQKGAAICISYNASFNTTKKRWQNYTARIEGYLGHLLKCTHIHTHTHNDIICHSIITYSKCIKILTSELYIVWLFRDSLDSGGFFQKHKCMCGFLYTARARIKFEF